MKNHKKNIEIQKFYAIRKEEGLKIDPETAEFYWQHANTLDPYGIEPNLPAKYRCVGREYFARAPGSEIWVAFADLPTATLERLEEKQIRKPAFQVRP